MRKQFTKKALLTGMAVAGLWMQGAVAQAQVLYDNGPIMNSPGTGSNGADESLLYSTTFGMGTLGFGHQSTAFNRVADDFDVTGCSWRIDSIAFFAYQTNSTVTSTMTSVNLRIWDGEPDQPGSTIIYGDTTTNRMVSTRWTGAYRVSETTQGGIARPIMRNTLNLNGTVVSGGNYWLDWQSQGTLPSGPWAPPRTPAGIEVTGNAKQRTGSSWAFIVDGGTNQAPQGLPFIIYGKQLAPSVNAGANRSICAGNSTTLGGSPTASGGSGPLTYAWSPATGLSGTTIPNPVATPSVNTSYFLTVTDSLGCTIVDTVAVAIGAQSAPLFPADTGLCDGATILLDAGPGNSYTWSNGSNAQTQTLGPGAYTVLVNQGTGCNLTDTIIVSAQQHVSISGNATFCANPGQTLCAVGSFTSYAWNNGATTSCINVTTSAPWSVTATDQWGCTSNASLTVTATPDPFASFSFTVGGVGLTYAFTDGSFDATSWLWNFGDGGSSTQQNPSHTYGIPGSFNVTLIVSNACGSDTITLPITAVGVAGPLNAEINVNPQPAHDYLRYAVSGLQDGALTVELCDLRGRVLGTWMHADAAAGVDSRVDVSAYARGMYFLNFRQGDQVVTQKVVIE